MYILTQPRGFDPKKKPKTNKHANKQGKGQKQREKKGSVRNPTPNANAQRAVA